METTILRLRKAILVIVVAIVVRIAIHFNIIKPLFILGIWVMVELEFVALRCS